MITIYKRIPSSEIRKDGKALVKQSKKFFAENPKRRVLTAGVWYGKVAKIRRTHIEEDAQKAIDAALG